MMTTDTDFIVASAKMASVAIRGVRLFKTMSRERFSSLSNFWRENEYVLVEDALTEGAMSLLKEHITYEQMNSVNDPRQFFRVHDDRDPHYDHVNNPISSTVRYNFSPDHLVDKI